MEKKKKRKHQLVVLTVLILLFILVCVLIKVVDKNYLKDSKNHLEDSKKNQAFQENEDLKNNKKQNDNQQNDKEQNNNEQNNSEQNDKKQNQKTENEFDSLEKANLIKKIEQKISQMTLEEKVGQMFFVRCPQTVEQAVTDIKTYQFGGYIFFANHFEGQTSDSIRENIKQYQENSNIPLLLGVDEEGGTVTRISRYKEFRNSKFESPQQIFSYGGMQAVIDDTKEKSELLSSLYLNVNLAPVCDVTQNPSDYMYARSFGKTAAETAEYVKTVVTQMKQDKIGSVLKHFPGYGNNENTHDEIAVDKREYNSFLEQDFWPFQAGIEAGADSILVSHTIVTSMDDTMPASLSKKVHQILRQDLEFDGVIMTDDLIMQAITNYTESTVAAVQAVIAGNDMLIVTDYMIQYPAVLEAVKNGEIEENVINAAVKRILLWKAELGLLENFFVD